MQWLSAATIAGLLGLLVAIYTLPPNLSIETVINKHSRIAFESRLLIKNLGKLPAYNIWVNVSQCSFRVGSTTADNLTFTHCGQPVTRLSHAETMEIPALPHVGIPPGAPIDQCAYQLMLEYKLKLLGYSKTIEKKWHVELRPLGEEFTWQVKLL